MQGAKLKRCGFLPQAVPDAEALACEADDRLFKSILLDPNHVLRKHFPETRPTNYNLRPRAHEFKLPLKDDRNFVPRLIFKDTLYVLGRVIMFYCLSMCLNSERKKQYADVICFISM